MSIFIESGLQLTAEQSNQLAATGVTVGPLRVFWALFPDLDFVTAVGGAKKLLSGEGQARNEGFGPPGEPSKEFLAAFYAEEGEEGAGRQSV